MYYDLLARIKNAVLAGKKTISAPFSGIDFEVSKVLVREGYLKSVEKRTVNKKNFLDIVLAYNGKKSVFHDFDLVSTPRRHLYRGYRDIKSVKHGHGIAVFSTSHGVMTGKDTKEKKVGGEYLFKVW